MNGGKCWVSLPLNPTYVTHQSMRTFSSSSSQDEKNKNENSVSGTDTKKIAELFSLHFRHQSNIEMLQAMIDLSRSPNITSLSKSHLTESIDATYALCERLDEIVREKHTQIFNPRR